MKNNNLHRFVTIAKKYLNKKNINTIVEVGARDCAETLDFYNLVRPKKIYTFECNPATLPICRKRIKGIKSIHLIEKAVCNKNGKIKFYPIDQKKTRTTWKDGNPGASSLFKASEKYPIEKYVQKEIEVVAIRLESFMRLNKINEIDLLWMDIQGAELLAIRGLGNKIRNVKFIYTEVEFFEIYKNQPLFKDVKGFLENSGFILLGFTNIEQYAGDAIFINKRLIKNKFSFFRRKFFGDQELLWIGYRPMFLIKAVNLILKIRNNLLLKINRHRDLSVWNKKLINFNEKYKIDVNIGLSKPILSNLKIDVIIPVAMKDINILPYCINSIRRHVKHPVNNIFIISSKTDDITTFCNTNSCTFIDEDTVLPIRKMDIRYNFGTKDRSGWLFQQLLKLSGDTISKLENYVFVDADTVYIRDKVFENNNKIVFDVSDEYHKPYFKTYEKLLGCDGFLPVSLTSHNMMINTLVLKELKNKIEKRNRSKWYEAILKNIDKGEIAPISEQEIYGSYMFQNYRDRMILEYWYNLSLKRSEIGNIKNLDRKLSPFYKSISFHSYNK